MNRQADGPTVVLIVTHYVCLDPSVAISRKPVATLVLELADAVKQSSHTLLEQVIVVTSGVLHRELMDDLTDESEVGEHEFVQRSLVLVLMNTTQERDLICCAHQLGLSQIGLPLVCL